MSFLAIELNDAGIRVARSGTDGLLGDGAGSPGYAWRSDSALVTGADARRHTRLHPLDVHHRFWDRLDTDPLDPKRPRGPNRAEVACAHLAGVLDATRRGDDGVVIAVPTHYDTRQLGLLAGIARDLGVALPALVASPIAIDAGSRAAAPTLLVECTLHRCMLSVVEGDAMVELAHTEACADLSLDAFRRQWLKAIGSAFVRTTRFDPRHDATSEQRLDDALDATIDGVTQTGRHELELPGPSGAHRLTINAELLVSAGHDLVFRLARDVQRLTSTHAPATILLTHDTARIPGLATLLRQQTPIPVETLPPGAAALGLARMWPDAFEATPAGSTAHFTRRAAVGSGPAVVRGASPA